MTEFMLIALVVYMVGVVIGRFLSAEVGGVVSIIGAVLFVVTYLVRFIH